MRIAIIGSGISGLVAAYHLNRRHEITVYEADGRLGGHTNTVRVALDDGVFEVDTGFIVYNRPNYPNFSRLLDEWGVATQPSDMTFSVSCERTGVEWAGSAAGLVAQPDNLGRASYWRMFRDIVRFNRLARGLLGGGSVAPDLTLGELLSRHRWSDEFRDHYLIPLGAAVWSAAPAQFPSYPVSALLPFLDNHGLLRLVGRPRWRTVVGGSRRYVEAATVGFSHRIRLATPVRRVLRGPDHVSVEADRGAESYDHVVLATHSDQALELLADATPAEKEILGAITYQPNRATLHTDASLLPRARRAWASWNYHRLADAPGEVAVTYHMNRLQRLRSRHQLCVTLNVDTRIDPDRVIASFDYAHPVYDPAAVAAQRRRHEISGTNRTWYCGAYWGHGFHEDGVVSALDVCGRLR